METPEDGTFGVLVNGSWNGFKGLLQREVVHVHLLFSFRLIVPIQYFRRFKMSGNRYSMSCVKWSNRI